MIYVNFGGIRDPLKQNLALQFCRNRNKDASILTETRINFDQIHHIRNKWLASIFFLKVTPSNDRLLCVYTSSSHSAREQLARGRFLEGIQSYMENENEGNETKY